MNTIKMNIEFNDEFLPVFKSIFKQFEVKTEIIDKQEKDPTKMSKEEFFDMVDKARKEPTKKMTREERKAFLGV